MKTYLYLFAFSLLLLSVYSCDKEELPQSIPGAEDIVPGKENPGIPEGHFIATFSASSGQDLLSRANTAGQSNRIQYLRYILYKSTGEFVKEKIILRPSGIAPSWPLSQVRDTLPKDSYTAVFLGNTEKSLFPYTPQAGITAYSDVLINYTQTFSNARIVLPNAEMSDSTEYYMAKASFSDQAPSPTVTLQRIIGMLKIHRNFVDAKTGLNSLVNNISSALQYKNLVQNTVNSVLPARLKSVLDKGLLNDVVYGLVGGLDSLVNTLTRSLTDTIVSTLYNQILKGLTNQIGAALNGDATEAGALSTLGVLLNPWSISTAQTAVVTIRNFPKSMDFNLTVKDYYTGNQQFRFNFPSTNIYDDKSIYIKGFSDAFHIQNVNVIKQGIVSGILIDQTIDNGLILNGTFIDIKDSLNDNRALNLRHKADYAFINLGLNSYAQQSDPDKKLTASIELSALPGLTDIVKGIPLLGPILNTITNLILTPIGKIVISITGINTPALGVTNLNLSGGWTPPVAY